MNTDKLFTYLTSKAEISPPFGEALRTVIQSELYKPHQVLYAAGQQETRVFFIESGFARLYFYDFTGAQHTVKFLETGNVLFSFEGYYNLPSHYYVEIMAESHLLTLTYTQLHRLAVSFKEVSVLISSVLIDHQREDFEKKELIALSTEQRYNYFRKHHNPIFGKVPAKLIASYLQMSRETLGRYMSKK
jgi:CRP-like cAMP-binding protein